MDLDLDIDPDRDFAYEHTPQKNPGVKSDSAHDPDCDIVLNAAIDRDSEFDPDHDHDLRYFCFLDLIFRFCLRFLTTAPTTTAIPTPTTTAISTPTPTPTTIAIPT